MKPIRSVIPFALAALLAAPALAGSTIEVADPWARPTIPNRPGAAYLEIRNTGDTPDRLVGASAEGAGKVELHKAEQLEGVMIMSPVNSVEVPAGGTARLAPGGLHIMLFDLAAPLAEGDTLSLTLEFEEAGEVQVAAPVERRMGHGCGMGHGGGIGEGASGN